MCKKAFLTIVLLFFSLQGARAQESRGSIIGRVVDSSGGVLIGAQVSAVNVATNTGPSSISNNEGNYEIPYLNPGTYLVTAELPGFKKSVRQGIVLRVNDRMTLDFALDVGEVAESVVVTGETPLLQSASASLGMVMDDRRITELPLIGGNAFYQTRLSAGVLPTGGHSAGNPSDYGAATGVVVSGTRSNSSEVTLDGAPNMYEGNAAYSPPQDLVQELKVQTSTFDASLGHASGAVVNVSVKSGTNKPHGSMYYFDSRIRAVPWFSNRFLHDPATGPITEEKKSQANPGWLHKRWGATFTGPVVLPHIYDGHNRTFFSAGFEGLFIRRQATFTGTVPTLEERQGDFSSLLRLGPQYQIYDPATIAPAPNGRFSRRPFPGNIIPPERINPVAKKILGYWPLPNVAGTADGRQNFFRIQNEDKDYASWLTRVDHNLSENHRMFFRFNQNIYDVILQTLPTIALGNRTHQPGWGAVLDDVYVFNSQLLLNMHYGVTVMRIGVSRYSQGFDLLSLGLPKKLVDEINAKNKPAGLAFPQTVVDGSAYTGLGADGGNDRTIAYQSIGGTVTKIRGNHSFRFGGEFRLMRENGFNYGNVAPRFDFGNNWTRGPLDTSTGAPIGQGLASFLLGIPTAGSVNINDSRAQQSTFSGIFIQDDWKVGRRLTVNLGLRYEFESPATERFNRSLRGFSRDAVNPIATEALANYARAPIAEVPLSSFRTIGGLTFAGAGGESRGLWRPDKNNFAPRIGFAYLLSKSTVVRGGYGVFFDLLGVDQQDVNQGGFNQSTNLTPSLNNGLTFVGTLSDPFPAGLQVPGGAAGGLRTFLGRGISFFNEEPLNAYMQRWSLSFQHEWPGRILMDVTYVGNRGNKIAVSRELNPIPRNYLSTSPERDQATIDFLAAQVPNPFFGIRDFAGTSLGNVRVARSQLLRPFPHFQGIIVNQPIGFSWYHAMQVQAERRFSKGVALQLGYTWSKFMEATSFLNDTDPAPAKVISDQDYPMRLTISVIHELPVGRGKAYWSALPAYVDLLVGGWQMQGTFEGQSGQALGFGNAIFNGDLHSIVIPRTRRTVQKWFNTEAGFRRDAKVLANNIRTLSSRFTGIRGDGINNFDLSFFKNFAVKERYKAQFRMEAYNALNHVQFAGPNTTPTSTAFGTISGEKGHGQRQLTFALKLLF